MTRDDVLMILTINETLDAIGSPLPRDRRRIPAAVRAQMLADGEIERSGASRVRLTPRGKSAFIVENYT